MKVNDRSNPEYLAQSALQLKKSNEKIAPEIVNKCPPKVKEQTGDFWDDWPLGDEQESMFQLPLACLTKDKKMVRIVYLWRRCFTKAVGAVKDLQLLRNIHVKALKYGTTATLLHEERR
jgi:hypothetical protein